MSEILYVKGKYVKEVFGTKGESARGHLHPVSITKMLESGRDVEGFIDIIGKKLYETRVELMGIVKGGDDEHLEVLKESSVILIDLAENLLDVNSKMIRDGVDDAKLFTDRYLTELRYNLWILKVALAALGENVG